MELMQLGQAVLAIGAFLLGVSAIVAFVHWIHPPRYAETMAAFNDRLRMKYAGKLVGVAGGAVVLGGACVLLAGILLKERKPYELAYDARTDAIIAVPRGTLPAQRDDASMVTPAEERERRLSKLETNIKILWDNRRELAATTKKSPLARKLAKCRKLVRKLQERRVTQPDFRIPPPPRPAAIAFDEGLGRGDPGGDE